MVFIDLKKELFPFFLFYIMRNRAVKKREGGREWIASLSLAMTGGRLFAAPLVYTLSVFVCRGRRPLVLSGAPKRPLVLFAVAAFCLGNVRRFDGPRPFGQVFHPFVRGLFFHLSVE